MKRNALAWFSTKLLGGGLLRVGLWLLALPATLAIVFMFAWPEQPEPPTYLRLDTVDRWIEPLPGDTTYDLSGFKAAMARSADFSQARWVSIRLPDFLELPTQFSAKLTEPMAMAWFRFSYTVPPDARKEEPLALYGSRIMGGAYSLWVNGELVAAKLDDWRMQWSYPVFLQLPPHLIKPGQELEVALAVPYRLSQGYSVGSLYFGKAHELRPSRDIRTFFQRTLPTVGMVLVGLMGALSFLMWLRRRVDMEHLWLALLSVAVVVCNLQYTHEFSVNDAQSAWFSYIVDAAVSWLFLLFVVFAFRFNKQQFQKTELLLVVFTVTNTLLTMPLWDWQVNGMRLQHYLTVVLYLYILGLMTWLAVTHRRFEHWMLCFAIWTLFCAGLFDITYMSSQITPDGIWVFPYGAFLVFIVAGLLLQRRYVDALNQIERSNIHLSRTLKAREDELMAKQAQLVHAQRQQTLLMERERLVQDIHDGIGSSLMNSMVSLRDGKLSPERAANLLRECLDDLKIVIESLEPIAHDLSSLLGALRYRFGDRLEAAGLTLVWQMDDLPPLAWLDAPQALDILRVVQEIVSNTLKHARATEVAISVTVGAAAPDAAPFVLLSLKDNGKGFDPHANTSGRGLKHIRARLHRIGAALTLVARQGQGVCYEIRLPITQGFEDDARVRGNASPALGTSSILN